MITRSYEILYSEMQDMAGLVHSPCGIIGVIMMFGGGGLRLLVCVVLQLHCQQILVVIIHSCG